MDRLSLLLTRFSMRSDVFYAGALCGLHEFEADSLRGHIHLIRHGPVDWVDARGRRIRITVPSVLFLPRPDPHRLIADEREGAEVLCATVRFGDGGSNPISDSVPDSLLVALEEMPGIEPLLQLMADEANAYRPGRRGALDRLCELLMVHLLRHCLDRGLSRGGTLAGFSDPRIGQALSALHADPARTWSLQDLAECAGMSRARFAAHFHDVVGQTPADYVADWRMTIARKLMREGRALKHIASDVGYASASAFTRAFTRRVGAAPTTWLKRPVPIEPSDGGHRA